MLALSGRQSYDYQSRLLAESKKKNIALERRVLDLERRMKVLDDLMDKKADPVAVFEPSIFHFFGFLFLSLIIVGVPVFGKTKDYYEYLAYIFPALAAFAGGSGIYFSARPATIGFFGWKKSFPVDALLYTISVFMIFAGLICFILYKKQVANIFYAMVFPPGLACAVFFSWRRYKKLAKERNCFRILAFYFSLLLLIVYLGYTVWWLALLAAGHLPLIRESVDNFLSIAK